MYTPHLLSSTPTPTPPPHIYASYHHLTPPTRTTTSHLPHHHLTPHTEGLASANRRRLATGTTCSNALPDVTCEVWAAMGFCALSYSWAGQNVAGVWCAKTCLQCMCWLVHGWVIVVVHVCMCCGCMRACVYMCIVDTYIQSAHRHTYIIHTLYTHIIHTHHTHTSYTHTSYTHTIHTHHTHRWQHNLH